MALSSQSAIAPWKWTASITVTVNAVNDAPVPTFDTDISTDEDTPAAVKSLTADDADGDELFFYIKTGNEPANGDVLIGSGQYTYDA